MTKTSVNTHLKHLLVQALLVASTLAVGTASAGKIKCWTNSDGIRECGNVVPPEYAQKGHVELNKQGVTVKQHERALSPEEVAERKRIEDEEKARKAAEEEQFRKDQMLLNTFASEDEIVMTRDGKIKILRTEIKLTRNSLNNARKRLNDLRKQAADLERAGKPVPKKLNDDIAQAKSQVDSYKEFIASKDGEQQKINSQFDSDLKRFRELRRPSGRLPSN